MIPHQPQNWYFTQLYQFSSCFVLVDYVEIIHWFRWYGCCTTL